MKKHLWFLVGMTVLLAGCFGSGGGGGDGGGGPPPEIAEGPKASYLLYSGFDGTDWEIYLLNPNLPPPAAADAPAPDPQAPQFEIIRLTDNETADIMPAGAGTNLFWQCDDGAGSEFCTMDVLGKKFSQLTTVAGGGALGKTTDPEPFFRTNGGDLIVAETSPQGRANYPSNGIMKYNPADKSLVMKSFGEITGVADEFSRQFLSGQPLIKGGNIFFMAFFTRLEGGDVPGYVSDGSDYMMTSAGEIKKTDNFTGAVWDYKDSVLALNWKGGVFGAIDQTTAQFSPVKTFEEAGSVDTCMPLSPGRGLFGMRVIRTREFSAPAEENGPPSVSHKLYAYNDPAKELKFLKEIPVPFGSMDCFQSADGARVLVSQPTDDGNFVYKVISIDTGEESEIYRSEPNEFFIGANDDLSTIVLFTAGAADPMMGGPVGTKLIFVDTASKAKTEADASVRRGSFLKGGKNFVFESASGDAFMYDLSQKKLISLPMPVFPGDLLDQSEQEKFIFLRRQSCPVSDCSTYDRRATSLFKIYKVGKDRVIDVPNNGKDIVTPVWIELTQEQYAKWKEAAADADFVKSAKPSADRSGPALEASSRFLTLNPGWLSSTSASAYSRQPGASLTWTKVEAGVEGPIVSESPLTWPNSLTQVLGLYSAFSVATVEFGRPGTGSGVLTVRVNDGAATAEENIGYYMEPPEPPESSHPPTITAVRTTIGRTIANGGTWVCSLSEATGLESDLAAATAHNAAVVAREVAAIGDFASTYVTAIAGAPALGAAARTSLRATAIAISARVSAARILADAADSAAGTAILASATRAQTDAANASADTTRSATIGVRGAITNASTLAADVAGTTEDTDIDENAGRIARAATDADIAFARDNFIRNLLPGCTVSVNVSDTGGDILEPFAEGLAGGVTSWMVEGETGSGTVTFAVPRPADGTGLPAPASEARIRVTDQRGGEAVFRLNLSVTY